MINYKKIFKSISLSSLLLLFIISGCDDSSTGTDTSDKEAPTVLSTSPLHNAIDIEHDKNVTVTFSEEIDISTINASSFKIKQGSSDISGVVSYSIATATFNPTNLFLENLVYTSTISKTVTDLAGNSLVDNISWSFTAVSNPDTQAPTILTTSPITNETDVARNKEVEITFSEAMDSTTITNVTFTVKHNSTDVAGVVSYSNERATFSPTGTLGAALVYTASISVGAKDVAGNALIASKQWSFTTSGQTEPLAIVNIGTAGNYVILAKSAITNNPTSNITGNLGISPAAESYITGFALTDATGYATSSQITGQVFAADMADPTPINLTTAISNMEAAYTDASGRPSPDFFEIYTGNISGKTLSPGLYKWTNSVTVLSDVTLSGETDDVWIFQIDGDLILNEAVKITLSGGTQPNNIFWQVAGEVLVRTSAHFEGIILSKTGITFQSGASLNGRALAQTAVILDSNTFVQPEL